MFSTSKFPENAYNQSDELGREGAGGIQHLYGDLPYMECPPDEDDAPGADAPDLFLPAAHSADAGMNESELSELYIDIKDRVNAKITAYNHDSLDYDDDGNELQGLGPLPNNLSPLAAYSYSTRLSIRTRCTASSTTCSASTWKLERRKKMRESESLVQRQRLWWMATHCPRLASMTSATSQRWERWPTWRYQPT